MTRSRATAIGFTAVLLWSSLALLTVGTAPVPPFQLSAMTFAIGGAVGLAWVTRNGFAQLRGIGWRAWGCGTLGLFGYHALYFSALRLAPAAEAGLIAYLWPLFIVLLSGLLPAERLGRMHIAGALIALAGAALIVLGAEASFDHQALPGYGLALAAAVTWALYSVGARRMASVPTAAVAVYCLATASLSLAAHLVWEATVWPQGVPGWLSVAALGLGPVGIAFLTWDIGMKRGDIQLLGVASYAAPLLSTMLLVLAGIAPATATLALAGVLITLGAALAARASAGRVTPATGG